MAAGNNPNDPRLASWQTTDDAQLYSPGDIIYKLLITQHILIACQGPKNGKSSEWSKVAECIRDCKNTPAGHIPCNVKELNKWLDWAEARIYSDPELRIVGSNLNSSATIVAYPFDVHLNDESSQSPERKLIIPWSRSPKLVIVVGDQRKRQLPPTVRSELHINNLFTAQHKTSLFE
ncbi:hypothetical protein MMC17_003234 [Xylographa soralifera]|nr:hypothetical protein [Xylographa soralifera]